MIKKSFLNIKDQVIYGYLNGKTRDEIARECGISTGKTSAIIKGWKQGLEERNIEKIRETLFSMAKSGMTIEQCAQGHRIICILNNLGIHDEENITNNNHHSNTSIQRYLEFISFIEGIYLNCKRLGISPSIIFAWIKDLLEHLFLLCNNNQTVPFVSQVSNYIYEKKKEYNKINDDVLKQEAQLKSINQKIQREEENLAKLLENKKMTLYCINWFYNLKEQLLEKGIIIENISEIVNVISAFNHHNYDVCEIIKEYSVHLSLKEQITDKQTTVESLAKKEESLKEEIVPLEYTLNNHRVMIDTYYKLACIGFGFRELKQLRSIIFEIAQANNIYYYDAILKFFDDVKEQYDVKLGFEKKIKEQKAEYEKIKKEFPDSVIDLQIKYYVSPVLYRLLKAGVTEMDIININSLVTEIVNNNFLTDPSSDRESNSKERHNMNDRVQYWDIFKRNVKELCGFYPLISKLNKEIDKLEKQRTHEENQKKNMEIELYKSLYLLNYLTMENYVLLGLVNHTFRYVNKLTSLQNTFLLLNIIYINYKKEDNSGTENQDIDG